VGITIGYRLDSQVIGVRLMAEQEIFLFSVASRLALGPTQPPIQWVCADHSPPTSTKVKNDGAMHPLPHMSEWYGS
jgi:hypothetical protein